MHEVKVNTRVSSVKPFKEYRLNLTTCSSLTDKAINTCLVDISGLRDDFVGDCGFNGVSDRLFKIRSRARFSEIITRAVTEMINTFTQRFVAQRVFEVNLLRVSRYMYM